MTPLETVQQMYAAFGRGDVPAILAVLAEDVQWEYGDPGPIPAPVPWLQPRRGREAVRGFFQALAALEFHRFEPRQLLAEGSLVVSLVDLEVTVRATGQKVVEDDEVHLWHFNPQGQVSRFRHRADSWAHAMALRGGAPAQRPLQVLGERIEVLADAGRTGRAYEQFLLEGRADSGPPLHRHPWDETYCVLEGELDVLADGRSTRLGAGAYLRVPGGVAHSYRIASAQARVFVTTAGSGAPSEFFAAMDRELPPGPPELARVLAIASRYQVEALGSA